MFGCRWLCGFVVLRVHTCACVCVCVFAHVERNLFCAYRERNQIEGYREPSVTTPLARNCTCIVNFSYCMLYEQGKEGELPAKDIKDRLWCDIVQEVL
jgi:hypothetical protein